MANVKISQLPAVTQSNNSDLLPIVSSGVTSQITRANFASSLTGVTASYVNPLTQSLTINGALNVFSYANSPFAVTGSQNGFVQLSMQNAFPGISSSTDIVAYADNGTYAANFIDMGINSSGIAPGYSFGNANDSYIFNTGGNLWISNASAYYQPGVSSSIYLTANSNSLPDVTVSGSKVAVGYNFVNPQYTLDVSGSSNINNGLTLTGSFFHSGSNTFTGSLFVTGTVLINGNNLSNVITYPYTGSASISGSLTVVGNILGYNSSSYVGNLAGFGANATSYSVFVGEQAGYNSSNSANSTLVGAFAGFGAYSSSFITAIGYSAGISMSNAGNATVIGPFAGYGSIGSIGSNSQGIYAGAATSGSIYSTFVGPYAGYQMSGSSYSNVIGYNAGFRSTLGNNNIIIGTEVTLASGSSNSINIGGLIFGSGSYFSTSSVSSGSANGYVGINQPNPQYSLDVSGSIRLSQALLLPPQNPLPIAATGSLETSGSSLYFYNGTGSNGGWAKII